MSALVKRVGSYEEAYQSFRWNIPDRYNIAADVCDRHARDATKVALLGQDDDGSIWTMTFRHVQRQANRLANLLRGLGLKRGDRVMILLGQDPWTAIAHVACWKSGLISVPAPVLFGPDAIAYRLEHASIHAAITNEENVWKLREARTDCLRHVLVTDAISRDVALSHLLASASDHFVNVDTAAEEPAFLNFTSGTTGNPKGALQAHRTMLGHMPGTEFSLDFFPAEGDIMWSPADWAWLAGLMDVLMPAWYHGVPVLTHRDRRFDPERAFMMMGRHAVRTALITPTMLKLMRQVTDPVPRFGLSLRTVISGSEAVGEDLHAWANDTLGAPVNEVFGQTECNIVLGNNSSVMRVKPGSIGRPMPGHECAIVDGDGNVMPQGAIGNIAVRAPDPVMMLGYWNDPEATRRKFADGWLLTGDTGRVDEDGYFWFTGRDDDIISSGGYRIGPTEIEDALGRHPAVLMAAVIGVPDSQRGQAIKAFVVLKPSYQSEPDLAENLKAHVRKRLAGHEVPREIAFVDSLPMSSTGKILRRELRQTEHGSRTC